VFASLNFLVSCVSFEMTSSPHFFTQKRFEMAPHAKPFRRVPLE